jgi:hypothetical protein
MSSVGDLPKLKEVWRWVKNLVFQYVKLRKSQSNSDSNGESGAFSPQYQILEKLK